MSDINQPRICKTMRGLITGEAPWAGGAPLAPGRSCEVELPASPFGCRAVSI
jgi:hypothetical protein